MKKLLISLALVGVVVACKSQTTEVTDTSMPAMDCTSECTTACETTCDVSGETYCSEAMEAYKSECSDKSECSAEATECQSEAQVCPVTGKAID